MKNDDLERLEESREIQRLIRFTKEQYEREKAGSEPAPFSSLMGVVRKREGRRSKRGISPWWMGAACLLGCAIGYGFSGMRGDSLSDRVAIADTVVVVRQQVDTIYREVQPKSVVACGNAVKSASRINTSTPEQETKRDKKKDPDLISPAYLERAQSLPDPDSEYYAANGMTVAEDNYPIHLLVSMPCK